ncbi:MAG: hemolysin-type calcium-binding protein, partial [Proteobacteria bacterium]|nr:hemolysin-type calcium-binding protein [Pseudomonadota bacterium]
SFVLTNADIGKHISVQGSYTDGGGTHEQLTSAQVGPVTNVNAAPTGSVTINGSTAKGQTLTANTSGVADADGLGSFSYQWLREGAQIASATGSTLVLTNADVGKHISVQVSYTDGGGTNEQLTSAQVGPVTNVNAAPTGAVNIVGTPSKGQTLTANTAGVADADGLGPFSYQWLRDGMTVSGANGSAYLLTNADVGKHISVQVSYTDGGGTNEQLTSAQVGPVTNVNAAPTGNVVIDGSSSKGQTLSANTTGVADADGLGAFSYQWLREGAQIAGATGSSFVLTNADIGKHISVQVSYTDGGGTNEQLTSAQVGPVTNVNSAPTGAVTINGSTANGPDPDGQYLGCGRCRWPGQFQLPVAARGSADCRRYQ